MNESEVTLREQGHRGHRGVETRGDDERQGVYSAKVRRSTSSQLLSEGPRVSTLVQSVDTWGVQVLRLEPCSNDLNASTNDVGYRAIYGT